MEYWSDPLCIWAFVTEDRLERVQEHAEIIVRWHVVPVFGSIPQRFAEGSWAKGGVEGRIEATRRVAERFGVEEVSGRCWADDCPASSWAPSLAFVAARLGEERGELDPGAAARLLRGLRRRFFVEDQNVAHRSVQLSVAEELELPRSPIESRLDDGSALASLYEDHTRAREDLHIQGSPTFVFDGGRAMLYGAFSEGILTATIEQLVAGLHPGASRC